MGSSSALATCETSQVLLAGVSYGFSRGSPVSDGQLPDGNLVNILPKQCFHRIILLLYGFRGLVLSGMMFHAIGRIYI